MNGTRKDDHGDRSAEDYIFGRERAAWHAILGVALILGGLALLAARAEWLDLGPIWRWWPLILIGLGLAKLVFDRAEERSGAIWLLAAGVYCGIGVWEPYGLSWATGWPVMLVAAGVSFLLGGAGWAGGCGRGPRRSPHSGAEDSALTGGAPHAPTESKEARHGS